MLKKIIVSLIFFITSVMTAQADIMPYYSNNINSCSIGVYQAFNRIKVYKEPNENSKLLLDVTWDYNGFNSPDISAGNLFVAYLPDKNLAFLTVTDENLEEDWLQISFNQNGEKTGWIKKDDEFRFMNWRAFFNLYGRKYGLYYLKDAPEGSKVIYGSLADDAKSIGKITLPHSLKLTNINGNWALVIAFDVDRTQKIGWIKWRTTSGEIFMFPNLK